MFRSWSWPARIWSVICVASVAAVLWPVFTQPREIEGNRDGCRSNLKQIGLGLLQYAQDYDEKLPPVASSGKTFGWADATFPYIKSRQVFHCPLAPSSYQNHPKRSGYTDYWFNARAAKYTTKSWDKDGQVLLSGDGNDGTDRTDARYSFKQIPTKWRQDQNSPLFRHNGAANYLFLDGRVKAAFSSRVQDADGIVF